MKQFIIKHLAGISCLVTIAIMLAVEIACISVTGKGSPYWVTCIVALPVMAADVVKAHIECKGDQSKEGQ